ncbi:AraC-type DNA-binding protein [Duganella sp. CF517]|uniref:AraC family transcriptional regulator n=1 Tax=Duganella sp. CF517 TaxID=1881038 RepID=UPI0008B004F8|nr:AraC family transcriptional regulator [Duganella sp. CF517]SEO08749.1 AraC-type DNA-binding protein [Duganella sp. CF517]
MDEDTLSLRSDVLSAALTRMKLRALINITLDAGGRWAVDFPALAGISLNVVQRGACWLSIAGHGEPVRLNTGDCFLLNEGSVFSLASEPPPRQRTPVAQLFARAPDGRLSCNGGGDFFVAGTLFRFEGLLAPIVLAGLPAVIHVASHAEQAAVLRWSLDRFQEELAGSGIGRSLILNHLAPIMLLQTLRLYLRSSPKAQNWLAALSDPRLSKALEAMHADVKRGWSLATLAAEAGMSRSGFAVAFKKMVGVAPMDYLSSWRMQIACDLLRAEGASIAAAAHAVGYSSESAFSLAFTRIVKCRPGAYRNLAAGR